MQMFGAMIEQWFGGDNVPYNEFVEAMLSADLESMNEYMSRVTTNIISYFDTGNSPSDEEPERFYHGFVLGLMVDQIDNYIITSNRESGFGRYDIMLEPIDKNNVHYPGIIIEFKVALPHTTHRKAHSGVVKCSGLYQPSLTFKQFCDQKEPPNLRTKYREGQKELQVKLG